MLSELFWILFATSSEFNNYKKTPRLHHENASEYIKKLGYNRERQDELHKLIFSINEDDKDKFYKILGHKINWDKYLKYEKRSRRCLAYEDAIREIANIEGWRYYDIKELLNDPVYQTLVGMKNVKFDYNKILMSPSEYEEFKKEYLSKKPVLKTYDETKGAWLPIILTLIVLFTSYATSSLAFITTIIMTITLTLVSYAGWFNCKRNKNIKFSPVFSYIICPLISIPQIIRAAINYELSHNAMLFVGHLVIIATIAHITYVVGYAIYYYKISNN